VAIIILLDGNATQKIKRKKLLKAWIFISEVYKLRRTNMSAVFGNYDGQLENTSSISLRTDTQITFSLHFTPLGIRLSALVAQPGAFLVLEMIILGYYSTHCLK